MLQEGLYSNYHGMYIAWITNGTIESHIVKVKEKGEVKEGF